MANPEHLKILNQGIEEWNIWRERNPLIKPNLSGARLKSRGLFIPHWFKPKKSRDEQALIQEVDFTEVNLRKADLRDAVLLGTKLTGANLSGANLRGATIVAADFTWADLKGADFTDASIQYVTFASNDLSTAIGLETVTHGDASYISTETLYRSGGRIPRQFLQGCGLPESLIDYLPSLINSQQPIQFYSCFISYSTKDEEFARRLYSRMRDEQLRVWFAPEDIKGGRKLYEQIESAIQLHDRVLLVLSENSMQSEWVMTEIRRAKKTEIEENRRKLFPITLVDFEKIKTWKCFDADTGKDLAIEVREYFIPDFSNWKDHDAFEAAFSKLLRDLKAEEKKA
jgi:uncharacterized protein YjbI with pentapeptide repeats